MEKEKVLEVEFQDVFDMVGVKIKYQNKEVLEIGKFQDTEIGVISYLCPDYFYDTLAIMGINTQKNNSMFIVSKEQAKIIKQKVNAINDKYGIPKRWRAKIGEKYWYISCNFDVRQMKDYYWETDDLMYNIGNYFKTKEEAQVKLDKIKPILKED